MILDENLSWKLHILNVCRKISMSIGIIYKSSFCLSAACLRTLYFSLVCHYLIYCTTVWGSSYETNLNNVITLQKKIMRIVSKVSFDAHTDIIFKEQHILKFNDIYRFQAAKFMLLFLKGLLLNTFRDKFALTNRINPYNTRNSSFNTEQTFDDFQYVFNVPQFFILLVEKFSIVRILVCLVKC